MCYVTGGGPEAKCMRRPPLSRFVPSQKRGADPLPMAHSATSSATGAIKLSCTTVRRTVALPPRKTS
jgi:hypothetical protein